MVATVIPDAGTRSVEQFDRGTVGSQNLNIQIANEGVLHADARGEEIATADGATKVDVEIAQTLPDGAELEAELRYLAGILAQ